MLNLFNFSLFFPHYSPDNAPSKLFWKGALDTGKCGLFDATNTIPFIEPKTSPIELPRTTLSRKGNFLKFLLLQAATNDVVSKTFDLFLL